MKKLIFASLYWLAVAILQTLLIWIVARTGLGIDPPEAPQKQWPKNANLPKYTSTNQGRGQMTVRQQTKIRRGGRTRADGPHPIDIHVGARIRMRRTLLGMTQEELGDALALTFQQVQKNERGTNRVGASRLFEISRIFNVPIMYFYEEMSAATATNRSTPQKAPEFDRDPLVKRETLALVRAYYRIGDPRVRKRLFELIKALARAEAA